MNKSITQDIQNDNQISKSINRFFKRFRVASLLKLANASKSRGFAAVDIFQFLFLLIFTNRSIYMNLLMGKNLPAFAQDTAYRFMKMSHINWVRFTTLLATVISKEAIEPLTSDERMNVLIIDDSLIERKLSMTKGTVAMLELLKVAKTAKIPANHVLFDSWFTSPSSLLAIKQIDYDVIGMVKKTPKMYFGYNGTNMSLPAIYKQNIKRRDRSRYLLSVEVDVTKDDETIPAKVVFVRNKNKRKDYLCLISTDTNVVNKAST